METELTTREIGVSPITGFLGSGKTTIVNRLLAAPGMFETLVLVNEFGQVSIDDDLIRPFSIVRDTPVPFDSPKRFWSALEREAGRYLLRTRASFTLLNAH